MEKSGYSTATAYRRLLQEARPYWWWIATVFLLQLSITPLKLLTPVPLKLAVDNVLGDSPLPQLLTSLFPTLTSFSDIQLLAFACGFLIAISVFSHGVGLAVWMLHTYTGEKLVLYFRSRLFRHVQNLPFTYHDASGVIDSTFRIQYDAPAIRWITLDGVQPMTSAVVTVAAMLYVTSQIDWQLAVVAISVTPVFFCLSHFWGKRLRSQWKQAKTLQSSALSVVQESLGGLRVVKSFGTEDREQSRFAERAEEGLQGQMQVARSQGTLDLLTGLTLAVGSAAVLYIGVGHVRSGELTLGNFLLVWAYLAQLYAPLQTVGKTLSTLQGSLASADRVLMVLDEVPQVREKPNALSLQRSSGRILFERVGFKYREDTPVLEDVSFEITPGSCVGIVGPTGAGKSTLIALLMRFYDPNQGRIFMDDVDLKNLKLDDLRNQFSVVLQEPVLFSASIGENIGYAKPDATSAEIMAASRFANAHDFIQQAPAGYDAQVGERGLSLSGGERQRIALARAFLRDSPFLILDEPTSAVDLGTEKLIMEALGRLIQDRTTFLISHRESLLTLCDTVLTLRNGHVLASNPTASDRLAK